MNILSEFTGSDQSGESGPGVGNILPEFTVVTRVGRMVLLPEFTVVTRVGRMVQGQHSS
jgi:hypothetical protein